MTKTTWQELRGPKGNHVVVHGDWIAISTDHRLDLWRKTEHQGQWTVSSMRCGLPVFHGDKIYWGTHVIDPENESAEKLGGDVEHALNEAGIGLMPQPTGSYHVEAVQWSDDASGVLVAVGWRGAGMQPGRIIELNADGVFQHILWEGTGQLPRSYWGRGGQWALGFAPLVVVRGNHKATLTGEIPPLRMRASENGRSLLVVESNALTIWDTQSWTRDYQWAGSWLDGDLDPRGKEILASSFQNQLFHLVVGDDAKRPVETPAAVSYVGIGADRIAATFTTQPNSATAEWK